MSKARDFLAELDTPNTEPIVIPEAIPEDTIATEDKLMVFKPMERQVIEHALDGSSPDTIALRLALPVSTVRSILSRKDTKEYLQHLSEELNAMEVMRLKSMYTKLLDARLEEADGDIAKVSRKDTIDIMKAYQELLIAERKSQKPDQEQNIFVSILSQITGD